MSTRRKPRSSIPDTLAPRGTISWPPKCTHYSTGLFRFTQLTTEPPVFGKLEDNAPRRLLRPCIRREDDLRRSIAILHEVVVGTRPESLLIDAPSALDERPTMVCESQVAIPAEVEPDTHSIAGVLRDHLRHRHRLLRHDHGLRYRRAEHRVRILRAYLWIAMFVLYDPPNEDALWIPLHQRHQIPHLALRVAVGQELC